MKLTRGYTIVEVLIVLAISGVMLAGVILVFRGQNNQTAFNQTAYDIESSLTSQIRRVSASSLADADSYNCEVTDGRPTLSLVGGGGQGSSDQCLYLGKAIEVVIDKAQFYIYSVLGVACSGNPCAPTTSFANASPEPIVSDSGGIDLTDSYRPNGPVKVVSSKVTLSSGNTTLSNYNLVGYYNDVSGETASNQSASEFIIAKGYNFNQDHSDNTVVKPYIEDTSAPDISRWTLCLKSQDDKYSASLEIKNSTQGVVADLRFISCS